VNKHSIRSVAAAMIAALLLAVLAVPVAGIGSSSSGGTSGGASVSASNGAPFATYATKRRRAKRVVKRRVVRRKRRIVRRRRRIAKKVVVVAVAAVAPLAVASAPTPTAPAPADESALAQALLDGLKAQYPRYLGSATVAIGDAMGYQAVSYYTTGRIVISPTHTATLSRIMDHEIWHIIDWRDNGVIDWGEAIPPTNMSTYAN
jgi:hypothetical protein